MSNYVESCQIMLNHVVINVIHVHLSYNVSYEAFSIKSGGGWGGQKVLSRPMTDSFAVG
jgi:hypothetical protein